MVGERGHESSVQPCPAGFPPCPGCGGPLVLVDGSNEVCCGNDACWITCAPAGDVAVEQHQAPHGWPRPIMEGRPVPWVAPIIGDRVAWTALNSTRCGQALRDWLCQVCGQPLGDTAWLAVEAGDVVGGGALHLRCLELARTVCPALRGDEAYVYVEVRHADQANRWADMIDRLVECEARSGRLPLFVPMAEGGERCGA